MIDRNMMPLRLLQLLRMQQLTGLGQGTKEPQPPGKIFIRILETPEMGTVFASFQDLSRAELGLGEGRRQESAAEKNKKHNSAWQVGKKKGWERQNWLQEVMEYSHSSHSNEKWA